MLDEVVNLVKKEVSDLIINNPEVPEEKKEDAVKTTTSTLLNGLKDNITSGNMSEVMNLFGSSNVENSSNNNVANNIQTSVVSSLIQKVGLSPAIANGIATAIIPTVMGLLSNKINDNSQPGFNLNSIINAFSGSKDGNHNILSSLGKFFQ